jgi:membrane dipeptidase
MLKHTLARRGKTGPWSWLTAICLAAAAATAQTASAPPAPPVPACPPAPAGYDPALWQRAWALHHAAVVVDTHIDTTSLVLDRNLDMGQLHSTGHVDLPRAALGGLDAVFYSIYVDARFHGDEAPLFAHPPRTVNDDWPRPALPGTPNGSARRALAMIDGLCRTAAQHPERMWLCSSVAELRAAVAAGKHAALMGIEGGHAIEGDLGLLRQFARLGVRYMTLTHSNHNEFADSCAPAEPRWGGLNRLGVKVVREMNRLGMMVDVSHVSDATFADALAATRAPVICSHSSMRALCGHRRNLTDAMLRALAAQGGVVMINYNCGFLDDDYAVRASATRATRQIEEKAARAKLPADSAELQAALQALDQRFPPVPRPPLQRLVDHVWHALTVGGEDHVGLGSDFDGVPCVPEGMDDATFLPRLTYELLARGAEERVVRKVLGENLLRVFAAVEATARQLAAEPPAQPAASDQERLR